MSSKLLFLSSILPIFLFLLCLGAQGKVSYTGSEDDLGNLPAFSEDDNIMSRTLRALGDIYVINRTRDLIVGADLDYQSHRSLLEVPLDFKLKLLDVVLEARPDILRVTPPFDPWLPLFWNDLGEIREHMTMIAKAIRDAGADLMIADGGAEYYWDHPMDWPAFRDALLSRVRYLALAYQPEYYVVVKEPAWYQGLSWGSPGGMLTEIPTLDDWLELTEEACRAVKSVSHSTVTMVSVIPGSEDHLPESAIYFREVQRIESVDAVGFDIYGIADLSRVDRILADLPTSKPLWILETWDGHPDEQSAEWRIWSQSDWLALIARYANHHEFEGVVTFYSRCFCYIGSDRPSNLVEWWNLLDRRTPAFYNFEKMALKEKPLIGLLCGLSIAGFVRFKCCRDSIRRYPAGRRSSPDDHPVRTKHR
ncbi:MAG: hypothetical protein HXS50_04140 [Theionarchaea archaeon]|nr:hypothetical protein [Theionarchaea archaeon]